jgi:hypothetical protein
MSFTTNIEITKSYPAVLYNASEALVDWHEDHEISGTFWHAINATYNETAPGSWKSIDNTKPSYATVQNPDGSTSYFTQPATSSSWPTSAWLGSDDHSVYNAVDYGLSVNDTSGGANNQAALQEAVTAAINASGGTVFIPAGSYAIAGTVSISGLNGGLLITGSSAGTTLIQQTGGADIFDVTASGNPAEFGIRFRDTTFQYKSGIASGGCAINLISGVADVTAEDCGFVNCWMALYAGSGTGSGGVVHSGLVRCTISQNEYSSSTQVTLAGPECFVLYCDLLQMAPNDAGAQRWPRITERPLM